MNNRFSLSLQRFVLLLLCLLLLNGCGLKFYYNRLDWFIPWHVESYMSLSDEQQQLLEQSLDQHLRWHRTTQLPTYAHWLQTLSADWQNGLDMTELNTHQAILEDYWQALVLQVTPDTAELLTLASDRQIADLFVNLEEKNQEYYDEYAALPPLELRRKYTQFAIKQFNRWLGQVTPEQNQLITQWSERIELTAADRLRYRRQWQAGLRELLSRRQDSDFFETALEQYFQFSGFDRPAHYQLKLEKNRAAFKALILDIDATLTPQQKRYLLQRLASFAEDFQQLAQAG
ncbi:MAG: DUF6279 family lipoprotein [Candidatus Competibacteraceae bacterium]|nr:DUF6279 family lipoprotein [Candidatus Competibacteraceae bacterium]